MHEQNTDWVADVKKSTLLLSSPVSLLPRLMFFLPLVASSWLTVCFCLSSRFVFHVPPHHAVPCLPSQEFATSGSNNTDSGKSSGHLETKYKMSDLGLNFTQKWNTDNTLTTEVTMEDQVESRNHDYGHLGPNNLFYRIFSIQNICFIAGPLSLYSAGQGLEAQYGHFLCAQHWVRTVQTSTFTTLLWKEPDSH